MESVKIRLAWRGAAMLSLVWAIMMGAGAQRATADVELMRITFSGYEKSETLSNFPVLVSLSTNRLGFSYDMLTSPADGADLRFLAANQTDELNYEVESWNTNGVSHIWVQIPSLASSNDFFYASLGNVDTSIPDYTTNGATWSAGFRGVWHMQDATNVTDATGNGNDGTGTNGIGSTSTAVAGNALALNGSSHYVDFGNGLGMGTDDATLSIWLKTGTTTFNCGLIGKTSWRSQVGRYAVYRDTGNLVSFGQFSGQVTSSSSWGYSDGEWHLVTITYDRDGNMTIYVDGVNKSSSSISAYSSYNMQGPDPFYISAYGDETGAGPKSGMYFPGQLDEGRLMNVAASSNWVWACWASQKPDADLLTYGVVGTPALDVIASTPTGIGLTNATLRGQIGGVGGEENPEVYFCWGTVDPETSNTGDWAHVESLGNSWTVGDFFDLELNGLIASQTYFYRAYVTNSTGDDWSETGEFSTLRVLYVSTNATPADPWNTWDTAFTNLQEAIENVQNSEVICLAGGQTFGGAALGTAFPSNSVFLLQNVTDITLRGGYEALSGLAREDHPGTNNPDLWPTVLQREDGDASVLSINAVSNALIEGVTITNGWVHATPHGGGVHLSGCHNVTLSKCNIVGNLAYGTALGAGLYLINGDATLVDSRLAGNYAAGEVNSSAYGGGAYVASGGMLTILRSQVSANHASVWNAGKGQAGGIYLAANATLDIRESVIDSNYTSGKFTSGPHYGGGLLNNGTLWMQNCLVVSNWSHCDPAHSDGLLLNGGEATMVNCTIADNDGVGVRYGAGSVAVTNSIIWGHTDADLYNFPTDGDGKLPDVWYSCIQNSPNNGFQGCLDIDPGFVDRVYYHLKSSENCYSNGYFSGGAWAQADEESPVIDRGDPDTVYSREPTLDGGRVNMGAYGGTEVASETANIVAVVPTVVDSGATDWGHRTVALRGEVTDTGGEIPDVWFLSWIVGDSTTNQFSCGIQPSGFTNDISGLVPGATYQYVVVASNQAGAAQSAPAQFTLHSATSTLYVATNGNNTAATNWSTAYRSLQTAFDIAEAGDVIYAAGHSFEGEGTTLSREAFSWQNVTHVTLRGGYQAESDADLPGARDSDLWPTLIRRSGANNVRVLTMSAVSNALIESVTITNGSVVVAPYGGGVHLSGCHDVTLSKCDIVGNAAIGTSYGGGLYLANGDAALVDSRLAGNNAFGSINLSSYGGGAYVASGGILTILRSRVSANRASAWNAGKGKGGGIYLAANGALDIRESVIDSNFCTAQYTSYDTFGGGLFNDGTLWMQNCLVVSNWSNHIPAHSDGLMLSGGEATVINCTIADNAGVGIRYGAGGVSVTNSILWGHTTSNVYNYPVSGGVFENMSHTLIGGYSFMDGVNGCLVDDPLFDDQQYYHLQSIKGVYCGGYFSGGAFEVGSTPSSPGVDAGTNLSIIVLENEPIPNGRIVNMGAYGGTSVASISLASAAGTLFRFR